MQLLVERRGSIRESSFEVCGTNFPFSPVFSDRGRSRQTHNDAASPLAQPANTIWMVVYNTSPLDYYIKEHDIQPLSYYFTTMSLLTFVNLTLPSSSVTERRA